MNIHIIGAGIVGLSTASLLARAGHRVTVLEQHSGAAQGASFAPGGLLSGLPATAWPSPRDWRSALGLRSAGFPTLDMGLTDLAARRWSQQRRQAHDSLLAQWRAAAQPEPAATEPTAPGAPVSAPDAHPAPAAATPADDERTPSEAEQWAQRLSLDYEIGHGHLLALRTPAQQPAWQDMQALLQAQGIAAHWLNDEQLRQAEPGLNPDTRVHGALALPHDEVGNSRQLALALKADAQRHGAELRFGARVTRLEPPSRSVGWRLHLASGETLATEAVVICCGSAAPELLHSAQLAPPAALLAIRGYSLSAATREPLHAPRHAAFTDAQSQVTITRQGQRIRVTGGYRLARGSDAAPSAADLAPLYQALNDWFPGAALLDASTQSWSASVLATADGQPLLGRIGSAGLWLNIGHGLQGAAQSLSCAQELLDQITQHG